MRSAAAKQATPLHFQLPPLPYAEDALAPVISAETLKLHHGKHHKKYIDTMNQLLEKEQIQASTLEDVVRQAKGKLFNNAAQAWNHDFYWHSLSPRRQRPAGAVQALDRVDPGRTHTEHLGNLRTRQPLLGQCDHPLAVLHRQGLHRSALLRGHRIYDHNYAGARMKLKML